ncbi:MAG TPA: PH domain-containing protein [Tepidisphaeraceae bacterium]|jgi:uncharacterized RDD family membrane protein YckC|nr:PH domain-containing protein [Tepidisphaeraceae bacterium]
MKMPPPKTVHAAEAGAAGAAPSTAAARATSLGTLLGTHVLRDGELVLMILKPSLWFIIFNSFAFAVVVAFIAVVLAVVDHRMHDHFYFEAALFFIAGRLMFAVLQWMGRLYILTDLRVLRITGVFGVEIFDCPLRKVVRARLVSTSREKLVGVGSIEIIPTDEDLPTSVWQTIANPREIHDRLQAAINRAKQSGSGCA